MMKYPITNLNLGSQKYGYPIHLGIKNHEFKIVLQMLKPKYVVNINAKDEDGNNAIHFLMGHFGYDSISCTQIATLMIKKGIEINILNRGDFSPLHVAIRAFQSKSLKYALDFNAYLRSQMISQNNDTRQRSSSLHKNIKLQPFNFNIAGKNLWTPLHFAVYNNNLIAVELLLHALKKEKINVFARDNEYRLPQELSPFNSPIFKMIRKSQRNVIVEKIGNIQREPKAVVIYEEDSQFHTNHNFHQTHKKVKENSYEDSQLIHKYINRRSKIQQTQKQNNIRRVNSNNMLIIGEPFQFDKQRNFDFGYQDSDSSGYEESQKQKIRESNINKKSLHKISKSSDRMGVHTLQSSKTEKNLHTASFLMNQQNNNYHQRGTQQNSRLAFQDGLQKKSPRLQYQFPPLAPKRLLNHDDEQIEEYYHQDDIRYMSIPINFESLEEQEDIEHLFTNSVSGNNSSVDTEEYAVIGNKKFQNTMNLADIKPIYDALDMGPSDDQMLSNQYQSAPTQDKKSNIKIVDNKNQYSSDDSSEEEKQLPQSVVKDRDDDDEDFCDADEDAEAGQLGIMANKINKFDNHNVEQEYRSINESDALMKVFEQLKIIQKKRKNNMLRQQQKYSQIPSSGKNIERENNLRSRIRENKHEIENPFNSKNADSPEVLVTKEEDEGNVFETIEQVAADLQDYLSDNDNKFQLLDEDRFNQRTIKQKTNNIFEMQQEKKFSDNTPTITVNVGETRKSYLLNSWQREEPVISQHKNKAQLTQLNKDCRLYESNQNKFSFEECMSFLNNEELSLSAKYQALYQYIYYPGKMIDETSLKSLFDNLEDTLSITTQIIKADLLYLISLSKNKVFIPSLDQDINKYKKQQEKDISEKEALKRQRTAKSPEPTTNTNMTQQNNNNINNESFIKTPQGKVLNTALKIKSSQSNCKQLVIYETQNTYDILMQDAMLQSQKLMEKCNQKINIERQRSRERMKIKNTKSQADTTYLHSSASGDLGIISKNIYKPQQNNTLNQHHKREIPEFISKLNKSPSSQNIQNFKQLNISNIPNSTDNSGFLSYVNNGQDSQNLGYNPNKKSSFTPKSSSGQVFLAFQRQKQLSRDMPYPQSPSNKYEYSHTPIIQFSLNNEENYNDTLIQPQKAINMEPHPNHQRLYSKQLEQNSSNSSSMSINPIQKMPQQSQSLATIISNTIQDLQRNYKVPTQIIEQSSLDPSSKSLQYKHIQQFQMLTKETPSQQKIFSGFTSRQKELSQQIKSQVQQKKSSHNSTSTSHSYRAFTNDLNKSKNASSQMKKNMSSNRRQYNKMSISKVSPMKIMPSDISIERIEERIKNNLISVSSQASSNYQQKSTRTLRK